MVARFNIATECKHCGVKSNLWVWEYQIKEKIICGNCNYKEVILTKQLERVEIDPFNSK